MSESDIFGSESDGDDSQQILDQKLKSENVPSGETEFHSPPLGGSEGIDIQSEATDRESEKTTVSIPDCTMKFSPDQEVFLSKIPNFLIVDPHRFDPNFYEPEALNSHSNQEDCGRVKLKLENTVRWREVTNSKGEIFKESNSRFVKWSDGSYTLQVGKEVFDVSVINSVNQNSQLFVKQGELLVQKHVFSQKMSFKPSSIASETHKNMIISVADRVSRSHKICLLAGVEKDPEAELMEKLKEEEDKMKQELRLETIQRRHIQSKSRRSSLSRNIFDAENEDLEDKKQEMKRLKLELSKNQSSQESGSSDDDDDENNDDNDDDDESDSSGDDEDDSDSSSEEENSSNQRPVATRKVIDDDS